MAFHRLLFLLSLTVALVAAVKFQFEYAATAFVSYNAVSGVSVARKAYDSCVEKTNGGTQTATKVDCVFDIVQYVFSAVSSIASGGYGVSIVQDGIGGATETESSKPPTGGNRRRRLSRSTYDDLLLDAFNQRMQDVHGEFEYRAEAVVPSVVHPLDGLAYRLNIRDEEEAENYLHLHTNGSHAMALFHPVTTTEGSNDGNDTTHAVAPRAKYLDTDGHYYTFSGLNGLKVEWHSINNDPDGSSDNSHFLDPWVRSDLQKEPIMSQADAWDFQACNKQKTATFYYGRLIFELNRPGYDYENITPRGCS